MPQPIEKIALIVRPESPELASACNEVIAVFERFGVEVCVLESSVASLGLDPRLACKESELGQRAQALVSLGGDGTLISAVRKSLGLDLPVLGINMGRLGFLTAIKPSELEEFVPLLKGGEYVLDLHYLLQGSLEKSALRDKSWISSPRLCDSHSRLISARGSKTSEAVQGEAAAGFFSKSHDFSSQILESTFESPTAIPRILEEDQALCEKSAENKNQPQSEKVDSSSAHFSQAHSQFLSSRADEPLFPSSRASETSVAIHNTNLESSFEKSQKMDCHADLQSARNDSKTAQNLNDSQAEGKVDSRKAANVGEQPKDSRILEIESGLFEPRKEIRLGRLSTPRGDEIHDSSPKAESTSKKPTPNTHSPFYVLNEILITKKAISGMTKIYATINNEHFHTYRADGLIIATPTGSSAYNISAGGSLVHPQCRVILLTPVCAHSLTQRPMIVSDDFCLHFSVEEDSVIMLDGQDRIDFRKGDTLIVRGSFPIQLIQ
ncbi:NAD(+)/NADH kinase, partial [Helicobacter canis]